MQMYRYPPADWLPLVPTKVVEAPAEVDLWVFKREVPWLKYVLVGFAWAAEGSIKLHDFRVGGSAPLNFGEDPIPLRRHGWLLGGRFWPQLNGRNSPFVTIEADVAPEVSALIVPLDDSCYGEGLGLVSEAGVKAFAQNMGTIQMWDAWPDCVEHDEQALQHHADLQRKWEAWIEAAAAKAAEGKEDTE